MAGTALFPNEPLAHWTLEDYNKFMMWMVEQGASDVSFYPGDCFWIYAGGQWVRATSRPITIEEVFFLVEKTAKNPSAVTQLRQGIDIDYSFEVKVDRINRHRFRVNATACKSGWGTGANIVMRSIPGVPPQLEDLDIEPELQEHLWPANGLVLITGRVNTGKSTLIASALRRLRETRSVKILTYEAPVEFDLVNIPDAKGPLIQTEIPWHLESFKAAPRNSARRNPQAVFVGEARDKDTLGGMLEAAEIGQAVYATIHTQSVSATPTRIINVFDPDEQQQMAAGLIGALRLVVQQRLLPKPGGGRTAVREYLAFTNELRNFLYTVPINNLQSAIEEYMQKGHGVLLLDDVKRKYEQGLITEDAYQEVVYEKQ